MGHGENILDCAKISGKLITLLWSNGRLSLFGKLFHYHRIIPKINLGSCERS